ncbi:MAG: D-Ala-D-Ala carboxypeptidase family metallohydrolase [Bacteroidota bacterium]
MKKRVGLVILLSLIVAVVVVIVLRWRNRYNRIDYLSRFIVDPYKLASRDEPDSWTNMDRNLMSRLEKLSHRLGKRLAITSGYRSPAHNRAVGGVANSAHLKRMAVDIGAFEMDPGELARHAAAVGFRRIGVGRTFIHVDVDHSKAHPTAWGREVYPSSQFTKAQLMKMLGF